MTKSFDKNSKSTNRGGFLQLVESVTRGLGRKTTTSASGTKRGQLLLETLEGRQMMAGDVELLFTEASGPIETAPVESASSTGQTAAAEGEPAPDLVAFAEALDAAGVVFYGANWCPACTEQKQLFEDGGDNLPFVEVTDGDRNLNQTGIDENIAQFPTWEFPDGTRAVGLQTLQTLSTRSAVSIPTSEDPTFEAIGSQTVGQGSPLHIPIDAYDPNGGPLTVTVSVADPSLLEATVVSGNRSLRLDMNGFGDMVFELFETRAPEASGRVIELAESDFYDGIIFHRVVDNFVLQAGDPTGTGTSGSSLGQFDDDFHPDLQHNTSGILSFAKTSDDTNNSQFFVTETPTRHLDFNHSIFGILTEGEDVREAISGMSVDSSSKPTTDITISDAQVFTDTENSVIMLRALANTGSTSVTVTVTDQDGNQHSEIVAVNLASDTSNSQPFLNALPTPTPAPSGTAATLQLSSTDVEGDAVTYIQSLSTTNVGATSSVDSTTGLVTVTPAAGFVGNVDVLVGVQAPGGGSNFDSQLVTFSFVEATIAAPTSLDLNDGSDSGSSNTDNVTNRDTTVFTIEGVASGNTVEIVEINSGTVVGTAVATGSTLEITTTNLAALGDGVYGLAARQSSSTATSSLSPTITVEIDSTSPDSVAASVARQANVGTAFTTDLNSAEEGNGLVYGLVNPPTGAVIDPSTGLIQWTPTSAQLGSNDVVITMTDLAGNVRSETVAITVADAAIGGIKLVAKDLNGNEITSLNTGQQFDLEFRAEDLRNGFAISGIFSAYTDVTFDNTLVRPVPGTSIEYSDDFRVLQRGTIGTGEIDELGAVISGTAPTFIGEELIATVRFEALQSGQVNFNTNPAEESGNEFLLFLVDDPVPNSQIAFGSLSLAIDQGFTLVNDAVSIPEDSQDFPIDVLTNDTVVDSGTTLSIASVTQPAAGGGVAIVNGQIQFTAAPDFVGTTSFTYQANASSGGQGDATVTVSVTNVNDAPTAVADTFVVVQDTTLNSLNVLANDSIAPDTGETLTVTAVGTPSQGGTVTPSSNGSGVSYTPAAGFVGTETFTYTVSDGSLTASETVTVTVETTNNPPTAVADAFNATEDDAEASFDVLSNDTQDVDNETFTLVSVGTPSQGGTARVNASGTALLYTPAADFTGTETITYTIRDTGGGQSTGTATMTVVGVNDPPPATDLNVLVIRSEGNRQVLSVSDLPANVDTGETLTFSNVTSSTQGGTVAITNNGTAISYTPPTGDFIGNDVVTYTVADGSGLTTTGTLTLNVQEFTRRTINIAALSNGTLGYYNSSAIRIRGTNDAGEQVDLGLTNNNGTTGFPDLLPGDYTIEFPAIPFLQGGETSRTVTVQSGVDDGDTTVEAPTGRLRPEFVSIRDWLGSTRKSNILAAVAPNADSLLTVPSSIVDSVEDAEVSLNAAGTEITIAGKNDSGEDIVANIPVNQDRRAESRGSADGMQLLRISVDPNDVSFSLVAASSASDGSTSAATAVAAAAQPLTIGSSTSGDEIVVAAATRADVFVPNARPEVIDQVREIGDESPKLASADSTPSVDAAMPDVADSLQINSATSDDVAQRQVLGGALDSNAVDSLLSSDELS